MKKTARIMLGSLGVAHFVVAIALLPVVELMGGRGDTTDRRKRS
jgi:hypothetical protein